MYWNRYHPYYYAVRNTAADEGKYSTNYLAGNIGRTIRVVLNYTSNSIINQNVQYTGKLKEVGNDYFVITVDLKTGGDEDVFIYTVNLARAHFPESVGSIQPPTSIPGPPPETTLTTLGRLGKKKRR